MKTTTTSATALASAANVHALVNESDPISLDTELA